MIAKYTAIMTKLLKLAPDKKKKGVENPEDKVKAFIERTNAEEKEKAYYQRCSERDEAFIKAVKAGKTDWTKYSDFCKKYGEEDA